MDYLIYSNLPLPILLVVHQVYQQLPLFELVHELTPFHIQKVLPLNVVSRHLASRQKYTGHLTGVVPLEG